MAVFGVDICAPAHHLWICGVAAADRRQAAASRVDRAAGL
jgi:hypothetical protein